jgi:hypothetical protein
MFRKVHYLSVQSSKIKQTREENFGLLDLGTDTCPETSVTNYQPTLRNIPRRLKSQEFVQMEGGFYVECQLTSSQIITLICFIM